MASKPLRWTGLFGIAAGLVYLAATAAGSLLDPSYSQIRQHVSDLTATGAPTAAALAPPYIVYNLLVVAFAFNLYVAGGRKRLLLIGLGLLSANAIAGVMMVTWFKEDLGGVPHTTAGIGHVIFASASSLAIVAASFIYGFAFRRMSATWHAMSVLSFLIAILFIVAAPAAIIATASNSEFAGLGERAAIAPFIVWMLGVGAFALEESRTPGERHTSFKTRVLRPSNQVAREKRL